MALAAPRSDSGHRGGGPEMVTLSFPPDLEVPVLADYVSKTLGMNIVYDDAVRKKRVTIVSPTSIPKDSLLALLQSVLKQSGFALVDAEKTGFKKIVMDKDLLAITDVLGTDPAELAAMEATTAVTHVFALQHISVVESAKTVQTFLGKHGGNCLPIPSQKLLIVTDRAAGVRRIASLLELIDKPGPQAGISFVPVRNVDAAELAKQVGGLLTKKSKLAKDSGKSARPSVLLEADIRSNTIAVIAVGDAGLEAIALIEMLDVPAYEPPSPIRFYKLMNTTATDVLATIQALDRNKGGLSTAMIEATDSGASGRLPADMRASTDGNARPSTSSPGLGEGEPNPAGDTDSPAPRPITRVETVDAVVTVDANTNTVIVLAPPAVQTIYAELIAMLDRRRPQVMVEATLVTLDTSGDFSLGVEFAVGDMKRKGTKHLVFSSFGLSDIDPSQGSISLSPGLGFNGTIIDAGTFGVVLQALQASGRSKVLSAPKILVNDNATATLESVIEAPFTSVNASNTVATTSFAGYESAGTTLTVTPHISEGDHLNLEYTISLNSFSGDGAEGVPPPRQTSTLNSEVTVPDGHAIIIGGLKRTDLIESSVGIPLLSKIPILKYLFGAVDKSRTESTLFVFIRPTILRDDQFEDLKYLSDGQLIAAEMAPNTPVGEPMILK